MDIDIFSQCQNAKLQLLAHRALDEALPRECPPLGLFGGYDLCDTLGTAGPLETEDDFTAVFSRIAEMTEDEYIIVPFNNPNLVDWYIIVYGTRTEADPDTRHAVHLELFDRTDMAEYANGHPKTLLGMIPLAFTEIFDHDFETGNWLAYSAIDHTKISGAITNDEQGLPALLATIADCIENQGPDDLSEFVIPVSIEDGVFLILQIGNRPGD